MLLKISSKPGNATLEVWFRAPVLLLALSIYAGSTPLRRSHDQVRRIILSHKPVIVLKGILRPYSKHIYRFRARAGEKLSIDLHCYAKRAEDLVFWVQTKKGWYPPGESTALLKGIDKGGVTSWSGTLLGTGEYEIYVSNPPIADHPVYRPFPYTLQIMHEHGTSRANAKLTAALHYQISERKIPSREH